MDVKEVVEGGCQGGCRRWMSDVKELVEGRCQGGCRRWMSRL